jgi:hypothetical protein
LHLSEVYRPYCFISFASGGIGIIAVVADKGFVGIGNVEADTMEEFNNGKDFEIAFFTGVQGRGIDDGMRIFDVLNFMRGERRVDNILSEIEQCLIIIFLDGDIGMNRETGVTP